MYREGNRSWLKHLDFTLLDALMIELALIIAYEWRFRDPTWLFDSTLYVRIAVVGFLIHLCVVFFGESYTGILRRNKYQEARHTLSHCFLVFGGIMIYMYATKTSVDYSRKLLFVFFGLSCVFCYLQRVILKRIIRRRKLQDKRKGNMLIVADCMTVGQCISEIAHDKYTDFKVKGCIVTDQDMKGRELQGIPVVGNFDELIEYLRTNVIDEVYVNSNDRIEAEKLSSRLVDLGVTVHISLIHTNQLVPNRRIENYGDYIVLTTSMVIANARQLFIKRTLDIIGGLVGLFLTFIAFIIFAPIIKIQSPGPVFYKQKRIGRNGRTFNFYKFRSMYVNADDMKKDLASENEVSGNMFKMKDDPRVIPIGRFMRKYSIDEFPQFLNVLKGDMSLVGTRPPTVDEYEAYEAHHRARLGIKPGLTGMWQVNGRSDITDFEEVVALDTYYISNWNLGLDMRILFKTIGVVLSGKGSS